MDPPDLIKQLYTPTISTTPIIPTKQRLSRDRRLQIRILREIGWTYSAIIRQYNITKNAVQYVYQNPPTPRKYINRPVQITEEEVTTIIEFVYINRENRRLSYARIIKILRLQVIIRLLSNILRRFGFTRRITAKKPPINETNRQKRIAWALKYVDWTQEQWDTVFWIDEI